MSYFEDVNEFGEELPLKFDTHSTGGDVLEAILIAIKTMELYDFVLRFEVFSFFVEVKVLRSVFYYVYFICFIRWNKYFEILCGKTLVSDKTVSGTK